MFSCVCVCVRVVCVCVCLQGVLPHATLAASERTCQCGWSVNTARFCGERSSSAAKSCSAASLTLNDARTANSSNRTGRTAAQANTGAPTVDEGGGCCDRSTWPEGCSNSNSTSAWYTDVVSSPLSSGALIAANAADAASRGTAISG